MPYDDDMAHMSIIYHLCWPCHTSFIYGHHISHMFTICSPYVHHMFTICSPYVHHMFPICSHVKHVISLYVTYVYNVSRFICGWDMFTIYHPHCEPVTHVHHMCPVVELCSSCVTCEYHISSLIDICSAYVIINDICSQCHISFTYVHHILPMFTIWHIWLSA